MEGICLILSGGAARGLAHIGVYKYLTEKGFSLKAISGSSAGAIVGAFIAAGYTPQKMVDIALKVSPLKVFKPQIPPKKAFFYNAPVLAFFKSYLPQEFKNLKVPLYVSATNLTKGENRIFYEGNLPLAVTASAALPPFFEPVEIDNELYNDGGFSNDLPVETFLSKNCLKICVDVTPVKPIEGISNWVETTLRSFLISVRFHKVVKYKFCDLLVIPNLDNLGFINYKRVEEYVERGYRAAKEVLSEI